MVHIYPPDRFTGYQWRVAVETRSGAETVDKYFDTEVEALTQASAWDEEMKRTGMTIGFSSYER